ncbi:MAG: SAM-dependent methyltransferase [Anaerolineae bacterium]|nr:SAM-dependent methyltransferase [Anaerolineae bacterium]
MDERAWVPAGVSLDRPNPARIYDYMLGGYHNFQPDREMSDTMEKLFPEVRLAARVNRAFLRRAVTFLVEEGCDQFLDLGSGIPTVGNVHEVAQALNPDAHVVYVDIDPVAVAHSLAMLVDNPRATAIRADVRQAEEIVTHPDVQRLLDLTKPLGVLIVGMLHYLLDDGEAQAAVRTFRTAAAPGSYLAISHTTPRVYPPEMAETVADIVRRSTRVRHRAPEDVLVFFGDWPLVPPGLVLGPLWRPESARDPLLNEPELAWTISGVARKEIAAGED